MHPLTSRKSSTTPCAPTTRRTAQRTGAKSKSDRTARSGRIKLIPFEELRFEDHTRYLIKGWFPRVGVAVVYGPPKGGKSFWMTSVAMHVALGWNYRGHKVQQGTVVYCAFEGQWRFADRLVAFRQTFLKDHTERVPFFLQPLRLDLINDHKELIEAIRTACRSTDADRPRHAQSQPQRLGARRQGYGLVHRRGRSTSRSLRLPCRHRPPQRARSRAGQEVTHHWLRQQTFRSRSPRTPTRTSSPKSNS